MIDLANLWRTRNRIETLFFKHKNSIFLSINTKCGTRRNPRFWLRTSFFPRTIWIWNPKIFWKARTTQPSNKKQLLEMTRSFLSINATKKRTWKITKETTLFKITWTNKNKYLLFNPPLDPRLPWEDRDLYFTLRKTINKNFQIWTLKTPNKNTRSTPEKKTYVHWITLISVTAPKITIIWEPLNTLAKTTNSKKTKNLLIVSKTPKN